MTTMMQKKVGCYSCYKYYNPNPIRRTLFSFKRRTTFKYEKLYFIRTPLGVIGKKLFTLGFSESSDSAESNGSDSESTSDSELGDSDSSLSGSDSSSASEPIEPKEAKEAGIMLKSVKI